MRFRLPILLILAASAILAQGPPTDDPPSRVARLNWIRGAVSFQPSTIDTWTPASINYPLTTGDHIYTDRAARAEMHIGPNAIRLDEQSNFGFLNLDDSAVQMRFTEGAMEILLRDTGRDRDVWEIDTPNGAVTLVSAGDYRIDTDPDRNATMVTVSSGEAEIMVNGQISVVHDRETGFFSDDRAPDIRYANTPDDFDRFVSGRNLAENRITRSGHVPQSMGGYEDMETYGSWSDTPEYGQVWLPPVDPSWAPYRDGRWAWVEPWGWTWIDDAPWGFAPFHYGRWVVSGGRWVWFPGGYDARPVYAPALVVFVGGWGAGSVGWFPLGPREYYRPGYHVSPVYERNLNIGANLDGRYRNRDVPGAATGVSVDVFIGGRSVPSAATRLSAAQMANARMSNSAALTPRRESVLGGGLRGNGSVPQPRDPVMSRRVVTRIAPPSPPVSFEARRPALEQNQGRPLAPSEVNQLRREQPAAVINRAPTSAAETGVPGGRPGFDRGQQRMPDPIRPRLDSRPPGANPQPRTFPDRPREMPRQIPQPRQIPEMRRAPEFRPIPEMRQAPEMRQVPQVRPAPVPQPAAQPPAAAQAPAPQLVRPQRPPAERRAPQADEHAPNNQ